MCYSEEYKNRLVHVANYWQVFPCNSVLHAYAPRGLCHGKRCGNKWDLVTQILDLILHEFILWFSLSLACFLVSRMGVLLCFFSSWYSLLGLIKQHRLLCHHLLSATGTVEHPRAAGSQVPWHAHSCTKPPHCWRKSQHCTSRTWADLRGKPATLLASPRVQTELLGIARNATFLLKIFPASAGLWSLHDLSTPAALAGLALKTKARFSKETKITCY